MHSPQAKVTVGVYMRERFSATAATLRSIVAHTRMPYVLVIVCGGVPERYLREMEAAVEGRDNVRWIRGDRLLTSNESRNLIAQATDDAYVCTIENAVTVNDGWLDAMRDACEATGAGAATPMLREKRLYGTVTHFDWGFMKLRRQVAADGTTQRWCEADNTLRAARFAATSPISVETTETHCNFFSRATLRTLGRFDERVAAGTNIDLSCALQEAGIALVHVPDAVVTHFPAVRIADDEQAIHAFRWNVERAAESAAYLKAKWHLRNLADLAGFAESQLLRVHSPFSWHRQRLSRAGELMRQRFGRAHEPVIHA